MAVCPVPGWPLSPMTANFTDPALFGSRSSCAASDGSVTSRIARTANRRMMSLRLSRDRVQDVVDDEVCFGVEQQQMLANDAVFERRRQGRQREQQARRHRRLGLILRIFRVYLEGHAAGCRRVVLEDGFRVAAVFALQLRRQETTKHRANLR